MADKKKRPPSVSAGLLRLPLEGVPPMPQGLLSYEPTLREKIANAVYDNTVGLLGKRKAHEMQAITKTAIDFVPGIGDAVGANDMARDYRAGNYGSSLLSAVGLIPAVGDIASKAGKKALANAPEGIRAFHGSPHSFDKFSLDKIGTGEGAQAYGHGLYFADSEGVAKSYRDTLSKDARPSRISDPAHDVAQQYIKDAGGDRELAAKTLLEYAGTDPQTIAIADYIRNPPGSMYEVNIRANPDDFLDWDKPLSEQPKAVQEMARNADLSKFPAGNRTRRQIEMWRDGTLPNIESSPTGGTLHNALTDYGGDDISRTSLPAKLASQGVPGIKYLDAGSRQAGDGSRNYVVFDEKLIDIVRKYGLASAIGAGIITKEMGQQMQAQGDI